MARKVPDAQWHPEDPSFATRTPGAGLGAGLGACRDAPGVDFFPELRTRRGAEEAELAKAVCAGCPVRQPCLEAGLGERFGIWGGLTEGERRQFRKAGGRRAA